MDQFGSQIESARGMVQLQRPATTLVMVVRGHDGPHSLAAHCEYASEEATFRVTSLEVRQQASKLLRRRESGSNGTCADIIHHPGKGLELG